MKCSLYNSLGSKVGFCTLTAVFLLLGGPTKALSAGAGNLDLSGSVAAACDVAVTPVAGVADNLPLVAAQTNLNVGSVNESCNDPNGYTLTAQSANASALKPVGGSPDTVPYTFTYAGASLDLSGGGAVTLTDTITPTGASGLDKAVDISYSDPGFIAADTYTDTITFTIAAK